MSANTMQQHFGYKGRIGADHEGVTHKMGMQAQSGSQCADTTADLEIRDGSDLGPTNKFGLRATREVAAKKPGGDSERRTVTRTQNLIRSSWIQG